MNPEQGTEKQRRGYERDRIKISKKQTAQDQINLIKTQQMQFILKRSSLRQGREYSQRLLLRTDIPVIHSVRLQVD